MPVQTVGDRREAPVQAKTIAIDRGEECKCNDPDSTKEISIFNELPELYTDYSEILSELDKAISDARCAKDSQPEYVHDAFAENAIARCKKKAVSFIKLAENQSKKSLNLPESVLIAAQRCSALERPSQVYPATTALLGAQSDLDTISSAVTSGKVRRSDMNHQRLKRNIDRVISCLEETSRNYTIIDENSMWYDGVALKIYELNNALSQIETRVKGHRIKMPPGVNSAIQTCKIAETQSSDPAKCLEQISRVYERISSAMIAHVKLVNPGKSRVIRCAKMCEKACVDWGDELRNIEQLMEMSTQNYHSLNDPRDLHRYNELSEQLQQIGEIYDSVCSGQINKIDMSKIAYSSADKKTIHFTRKIHSLCSAVR